MGPVEASLMEATKARRARMVEAAMLHQRREQDKVALVQINSRLRASFYERWIESGIQKAESLIRASLVVRYGNPERRPVRVREIIRLVAQYYGVGVKDLMSHRRGHDVARPRQVAMYLAKEITNRTLPDLGLQFGGRDHTTILHGVRITKQRMQDNAQMRADVEELTAQINRLAESQ